MIYLLLVLIVILVGAVVRYRNLYLESFRSYENTYVSYGSLVYIIYTYIDARQKETDGEDDLLESLKIAVGYDEAQGCHCEEGECDGCEECEPQ